MKKANSDQIESISIIIDKIKFPIAYKAKLDELIGCGVSKRSAEKFISSTPIDMELYYSKDSGLFMVEAEAVESGTIINPYTGEELEEEDR